MQSKAKQNSKKLSFKLKLAGATCALLLGTTSVYAVPAVQGGGCGLTTANTSTSGFYFPLAITFSGGVVSNNPLLFGGFSGVSGANNIRACNFSSLPTLADMDTTCNIATSETNLQTNYVALLHTNALPSPTFCLYQYDIDTGAVDVRTNGALVAVLAPSPATAVPIFTPLGLLAMMSGLLWFGKRRRKFK